MGELKDLGRLYGDDARLFLLRCLLEEIDFQDHKSQKDHFKMMLLSQELAELSSHSNFSSVICRALESTGISSEFFSHFVKALNLPLPQQVLIALGLAQSIDLEVEKEGLKFLTAKLRDLSDFNNERLPPNVLHELMYFIRTHSHFNNKQTNQFVLSLHTIYPETYNSLDFSPLLHDSPAADSKLPFSADETNQPPRQLNLQPADFLQDLGYSSMATTASLTEILSHFPRLNEASVASMIAMMVRTHKGLVEDTKQLPLSTVLSMALSGNWSPPKEKENAEEQAKDGETLSTWNIPVFVETVKNMLPRLNWNDVYLALDCPEFFVPELKALRLLNQIHQLVMPKGSAFPLEALFRDWSNVNGHFSFLKHAMKKSDKPLVDFLRSPRTQKPIEGLHINGSSKSPSIHQTRAYPHILSLDLVEILLNLGETHLFHDVEDLLQSCMSQCPELLFCALVQVKPKGTTLQDSFLAKLMPVYLGSTAAQIHVNSSLVLHRLWRLNRALVIKWMVKLYLEDRNFLPRIVDIAQDLKDALKVILEARPFVYAIDLATHASQREFLNLEKWLELRIQEHGAPFVMTCLDYLRNDQEQGNDEEALATSTDYPLPTPIIAVFFKTIRNTSGLGGAALEEVSSEVERVWALCCQSNPKLCTSNVDEIEDEANAYFQQIYTEQLSLTAVVEMLKRFKNSELRRETDICTCMIHNLFDEYKFFYQYPEKELRITGVLFGLLIHHNLVGGLTLGIALRYVGEALKKPAGSKMFKFGVWAIEQFKDKFPLWPRYCDLILSIPHLQQSSPDLVGFLQSIKSNQQDSAPIPQDPQVQAQISNLLPPQHQQPVMPSIVGQPQGAIGAPAARPEHPNNQIRAQSSNVNAAPRNEKGEDQEKKAPTPAKPQRSRAPAIFASTLNLDTLLQAGAPEEPVPPPTAIVDKIHFIVNNVSKINMKAKAKELKSILTPEFYPWFSSYLVVKRVSLEPNFQKLYSSYLDALSLKQLLRAVVRTTYQNIRHLLGADKVLHSASERTLLKNLGSWLGLMTIARNKPLRAKYLVIKDLILDAYDTGRLIAVIPFTAKVLECCSMSTVFKPPNPWLVPIIALLREIFDLEDLKLNLKFEIEVLFNHLDIKVKDITPATVLKDRASKADNRGNFNRDTQPGSDPKLLPMTSSSRNNSAPEARNEVHPNAYNQSDPNFAQTKSTNPPGGPAIEATFVIPNLPQFITIHQNIHLFNMYPQLKRFVPIAIDRAINEIISPVVERSVTIACVTTKELVLKDFAMEPDETKMRKAAHQMVQNLTGSLALVTCKEPLKASINNHLVKTLHEANANTSDKALIEQACTQVSTDNLELGCSIIEKAAAERAIREIDEALSMAYQVRRKHREQTGTPYYDMSVFPGRFPASLPDALRSQAHGLSANQLRVYEGFSQNRRHTSAAAERFEAQLPAAPTQSRPVAADQGVRVPANANTHQIIDKLLIVMDSLEQAVARIPNHKSTSLASILNGRDDYDIASFLRMVPNLLQKAAAKRDMVCLTFAHKVFQRLYDRDNRSSFLQIDVHINVLSMIRGIRKIAKELTSWLLYSEDDRKFFVEITTPLLRGHLLEIPVVDLFFSKLVRTAYPLQHGPLTRNIHPHLNFTIELVHRVCVSEPIVAVQQFPNILDALSKITQVAIQKRDKLLSDPLTHLLDEVRQVQARSVHTTETTNPEKEQVKEERQEEEELDRLDMKLSNEPEPSGLRQEVVYLLDDWMSMCLVVGGSDKSYANYLSMLQQRRVLATPENTHRFFRIITELCIDSAFSNVGRSGLSYTAIDALSKLVVFLVKYFDPNVSSTSSTQNASAAKVRLLASFLNVAARVLRRDFDHKKAQFNQKPYLRLFGNLLHDLNQPDPSLDSNNIDVQLAFGHAFRLMRPSRVPSFCFAWLELISHRMFMSKLLISKSPQCAILFQRLLVDLLRFMEPYLRNAELTDSVRLLYKGTLRVLIVLLHDFPGFLCEFHFSFCDVIPPTCIQMRNLILSAFPKNMRLPDPFTPNLKVDLLPAISQAPRVLSDITATLEKHRSTIQVPLDNYLASRTPPPSLKQLVSSLTLQNPQQEKKAGTHYNVPLINSLVLYVGIQGIENLQSKNNSQFQDNPCMDIFETLVTDLDPEGRFYVLNAVANQLRFPNNHTHYFSCVLLYLFRQAKQEIVMEQITRVLLERLIVHRPLPWGLLITFLELIKNPRYEFWKQPFTTCAPEIKRLFDSVNDSCMPPNAKVGVGGARPPNEVLDLNSMNVASTNLGGPQDQSNPPQGSVNNPVYRRGS